MKSSWFVLPKVLAENPINPSHFRFYNGDVKNKLTSKSSAESTAKNLNSSKPIFLP